MLKSIKYFSMIDLKTLMSIVLSLFANIIFVYCQEKIPSYSELFSSNPDKILDRWEKDYNGLNNSIEKINILIYVSEVYRIKGEYRKMLEFMHRAEYEARDINDLMLQHDIVSFLAYDYSLLDLLSKSDSLTRVQFKLTKYIKDVDQRRLAILDVYSQFASTSRKRYEFNTAIRHYKSGLELLDSIKGLDEFNYSDRIGGIINNIAICYLDLNLPDSALFWLNTLNTPKIRLEKIPRLKSTIELTYGKIYYVQDRLDKAEKHLKESLGISIQHNYREKLASTYSILSKVHEGKHDVKEAQSLRLKSDELLRTLKISRINAIERELKNIEDSRTKLIKSKEKNELRFAIIIFLIVLFFLFIVLFIKLKFEKRNKINEKHYFDLLEEIKRTASTTDKIKLSESKSNGRNFDLEGETAHKLLKKLKKFEDLEKFTNPNISLSSLATQFGTNPNYLSELINQSKGLNFNSYINTLRIEFICKKILNEPITRTYKISYLAEMSGFASHSIFTKTFKSITKVSPSYFIEKSKEGLATRN